MTAWATFLDHLDQEVEQANRALDEGRPFNGELIEPWAPPTHLGVLPLELLERAQSLNSALNQLQQRTEAGQLLIKEEISRMSRLRGKLRGKGHVQYGNDSVIPVYVDRSV